MTDKIIKIISDVLSVQVDANTSQATCEKWDSLRHLSIIVALEEAFDISFEPEDIAEMKSIQEIEKYIRHYQSVNSLK